MNEYNYNQIRKIEDLIEECRLEIKNIKKQKGNIHDKMDIISNIYEYIAAPLCAISITFAALFTGPIVYVLPILMTAGAISIVTYKFILRKKLDGLNIKLMNVKKKRKLAYDKREEMYENIFNELHSKHLDSKDYYHQIMENGNACNKLSESMLPYKQKKYKLEKNKNILSSFFDYGLAPTSTVVLPLICSLTSLGIVSEVILMSLSSFILMGCASVDDNLSKKIGDLDEAISEIKSDRTVQYIKRDMKLKESLNFLKKQDALLANKKMERLKQTENNRSNKSSKRR